MSTDELYYASIDLLKQLIAIPSPSREEKDVADVIEKYLKKNGMSTYRQGNNIWCIAEKYDDKKPTLLLNSHIDTVKPVSGWKHDPFTPIEEDGRIYGLGSNDAGAPLVSLLHSFFYLQSKEQPYNLIFLASAEEEVSGKNGIESVLDKLPPVTLAVVGEPTGMQPAIGEKGLMVLDCRVYGKSGHAARNEGDNAIYKALKVIESLRDFRFPKTSEILGPVKMSVTMIQAGTQHNVIPDRCDFVVDIRTNELYRNEEAFEILQKNIDCEMAPRSFRLNSSRISTDHPIIVRASILGLTPFGSPTLSDQALMPFSSVKIGPGDSRRSHTADEYIETGEIREGIELYIKLLDQLNLPTE
ncbi:M20 family metallo-hydrolase [Coprobacter tertius]|uniref:M20 family metallo-hydrolase n=1 Tax=Coprobacter tertius TaxID=2944915 RepID=A0ABT1MIT5_9BACT|nr:M20 family metallo-hydrolase [Coprobacter tertius]MCP9611618.1 M20 family metallo-hydrolase [Coprobacter tertius]